MNAITTTAAPGASAHVLSFFKNHDEKTLACSECTLSATIRSKINWGLAETGLRRHFARMSKIVPKEAREWQSEDVYAAIGRRLRELRSGRGMTQAQTAEVIGVSPQQYQKYEDAQSKCSITNLLTLADHYGVSVSSIIPDCDEHIAGQVSVEADLLARLVAAYTGLGSPAEKVRVVQLLEAMTTNNAES